MNTLFIGHTIIRLNEVDSTNNYAIQLSRHSVIQEGVIISTKSQTKGKGRQKNQWLSSKNKNLTISIILTPSFLKIQDQFTISMVTSIACCELILELTGILPLIKWPNDILIKKRKIAGILIENILQGQKLKHSIIGIGLNVNEVAFPLKLKNTATSLRLESAIEYNIDSVLIKLSSILESNYLKLRRDPSKIKDTYLKYLRGYKEIQTYNYKNVLKKGQIIDITKAGLIKIEFENKEQSIFNMDEIKQIY